MEVDLQPIVSLDNLMLVQSNFGTETACEAFLAHACWPDKVTSPFDVTSKVYICSDNRYRCKNSKKYFNIKTKTLFHNSKVPLTTWFKAIWIIANSEKLTSVALAKELELTQKTAWYMLRRVKRYLQKTNVVVTSKKDQLMHTQKSAVAGNDNERLGISQWLELLKQNKEKGLN